MEPSLHSSHCRRTRLAERRLVRGGDHRSDGGVAPGQGLDHRQEVAQRAGRVLPAAPDRSRLINAHGCAQAFDPAAWRGAADDIRQKPPRRNPLPPVPARFRAHPSRAPGAGCPPRVPRPRPAVWCKGLHRLKSERGTLLPQFLEVYLLASSFGERMSGGQSHVQRDNGNDPGGKSRSQRFAEAGREAEMDGPRHAGPPTPLPPSSPER